MIYIYIYVYIYICIYIYICRICIGLYMYSDISRVSIVHEVILDSG